MRLEQLSIHTEEETHTPPPPPPTLPPPHTGLCAVIGARQGEKAEEIYSLTQPKAEEFGTLLKSNQAYITNFAEEVDFFPFFLVAFF